MMASKCATPHPVLCLPHVQEPRLSNKQRQRSQSHQTTLFLGKSSHCSLVASAHSNTHQPPCFRQRPQCRLEWMCRSSRGGSERAAHFPGKMPENGGLFGGRDCEGRRLRWRPAGGCRDSGMRVSCLGRPGSEDMAPGLEDKSNSEEVVAVALPAGNGLGSWETWGEGFDAQIAYALLLATVPVVPLLPRYQLSASVYFLVMASLGVYLGSHRSLEGKMVQKITFKQSLAVPLMTSASLFGFYCLLRFFPDLDLRTFVAGYLTLAGAAAVGSNLAGPFRAWFGGAQQTARFTLPLWFAQEEGKAVNVDVSVTDVLATAVGIAAALATWQPNAPFTVSNFVALCLVTDILQLLSLGSFATAATMLGGLLLYDVFWVFGSPGVFGDNVMVTVATSAAFNGPMKLIFPRFGDPALVDAMGANAFSILGLGDIAAPGLLIALMLRFDRFRARQVASPDEVTGGDGAREATTKSRGELDKTYFLTGMACYVLGLVVTVVANAVSGEAQPALLYLVPSLVGGALLAAVSRSELGILFNYRDEKTLSERMEKKPSSSD